MPSSVLKQIIEYTILSIDPYSDLYDDQIAIQRIILRRVSRQWNQVILRNPQLWTHIYLNLTDENDSETLRAMYREAQAWIQRSRSLKRTLYLISPGEIDEEEAEDCDTRDELTMDPYIPREGIVKFISKNSNWETVYIDLDDYAGFASDIFDCGPGKTREEWEVLRTLRLRSREAAIPPPGEGEINCGRVRMPASSYPALRDVTLNLTSCTLGDWILPWAQLTSLRLEMLVNGFNDYLDVLRQCSSLRTFHLTIGEPYTFNSGFGLPDRTPPISTVPTLRTLVIDMEIICSDIVPQFINKLRLPALESLHCSVTSENSYGWSCKALIHSLRLLVARSSCSLRHLALDFNITPDGKVKELMDEAALALLLQSTDYLETLSIKGYDMSCDFLIDSQLSFDHLESMTIVNYSDEFDPDAAANFTLAAERWVDGLRAEDNSDRDSGIEECDNLSGLYFVKPPFRWNRPSTQAATPPLEERHNAEYLEQFDIHFQYEVAVRTVNEYAAYPAQSSPQVSEGEDGGSGDESENVSEDDDDD